LRKRVILITGGSSGLGAKFVEALSASDENIIYFTHTKTTEKLKEIMPVSENTIPVQCDQRNENEITNCVTRVISEQERIDVLVNNACSSFKPCDFLSSDWGLFQDIIDVNVKGSYIFTKEVSKVMKIQGSGKIINILSSYVINVPPEKLSFYITAKYALLGLSKAAAAELCKYGITVNMISPGLMSTPLSSYLPRKYLEVYSQTHPMKRMTTTSDVANVLKFLITDGSNFLNGVNIPVNGGESY
jgi:3-oxoacyl-[acyl-carrier protein] reductase